jgi:hypothetical protein
MLLKREKFLNASKKFHIDNISRRDVHLSGVYVVTLNPIAYDTLLNYVTAGTRASHTHTRNSHMNTIIIYGAWGVVVVKALRY